MPNRLVDAIASWSKWFNADAILSVYTRAQTLDLRPNKASVFGLKSRHPMLMARFATFFDGRLSGIEITCIQSFIDHGHDIEIYSYGDCGAPRHFQTRDAASVIPQKEVFYYGPGGGEGSISGFTNVFRYHFLTSKTDVWWVDTDVVCLSHDWPARPSSIGAGWEDREKVGTAVLWMHDDIARSAAAEAKEIGQGAYWGQAGPHLITRTVKSLSLENEILPADTFYPVHWNEWFKVFMGNFRAFVEEKSRSSKALHLWNEMARRAGYDKSIMPDRQSYLGQLVIKHRTASHFHGGRIARLARLRLPSLVRFSHRH
jgi:hypothetical protein